MKLKTIVDKQSRKNLRIFFRILFNLSIGQLVAFSALLGFLYNPTKSLLTIHVAFQKSLVSLNHRLSTILEVDRIIILENGEITDMGTHQDLIKVNEFNGKIFKNQIISLSQKKDKTS